MRFLLSITMLLLATIPSKGYSSTLADYGEFGITYSPTIQHYIDYVGQSVIYLPAKNGNQIWVEDINNFENKGGTFDEVYTITDVKESRGGIVLYLSPEKSQAKKIKLKVNVPNSFYQISKERSIPLLLIDKFRKYRDDIISTYKFGDTPFENNVASISDVYWDYESDYDSDSEYEAHYPQLKYKVHFKYNDTYKVCSEIELHSYDDLGKLLGGCYEVVDIENKKYYPTYYVLRNTLDGSIKKYKKDYLSDFSKIGEKIYCADNTYYSIVDVNRSASSNIEYTIMHNLSNEISVIKSQDIGIIADIGKKVSKQYFSYFYTVVGYEYEDGLKYVVINSETGKRKTLASLSECYDGENPIQLEELNSSDNRTTRKSLVHIIQSSKTLLDATGWIYDDFFSNKDTWVSHKNYINIDSHPIETFANSISYEQNFFTMFSKQFRVEGIDADYYAIIVGKTRGFYRYPHIDRGYYTRKDYEIYIFTAEEYYKLHHLSQSEVILESIANTTIFGEPYSDSLFESVVTKNLGGWLWGEKWKYFNADKFPVKLSSDGHIRFYAPDTFVCDSIDFNKMYFETSVENFNRIIIK